MSDTQRVVVSFEEDIDAELFIDNITTVMSQFHYAEDILVDVRYQDCSVEVTDTAISHIERACMLAMEYYPGRKAFFESVDIIDNKMVAFTIGAD